jgi:hypothetical protein
VRVALLLVALVPTLAAQTPLRVGQSVAGRLIPSDQRFADSSRYKLYSFTGSKGDTISAELFSDDFDANLVLTDASGNSLARNDDGGENCNARFTYVLPQAATYRLYANSSASAELGAFRLALSRGKVRPPSDSTCRGFGRVAGMIQVGRTVTGTLSSTDPEIPADSTYFQRWILPVTAKQTFTVDLESSDFDAYLLLTRGRGDKLVENDDGGGGCHARLVYTTEDDHPLRILVNTASRPPRQTGRFTLRVSAGALPTEPKGNCRLSAGTGGGGGGGRGADASRAERAIGIGQTREGTLTRDDVLLTSDSTYAQAWTIQGRAGQTVTIDIESDVFDPYLFLRGPGVSGGRDFQDDDSGGNCNARLTTTFPQAGEYEIVVNSTGAKYATGRFSLSVTTGSKPKSVARCNRSE